MIFAIIFWVSLGTFLYGGLAIVEKLNWIPDGDEVDDVWILPAQEL